MAYTIYHADGTPVIIPDNTVDTAYYNANAHGTSVGIGTQLVGRNATNYGAPIAQNFLQMTENFASSSAFMPADAYALQGQLWFQKDQTNPNSAGQLFVRVATTGTSSGTGAANWQQLLTTDPSTNLSINNIVASGSITAAGAITSNGSITASHFLGDGSQLTGISVYTAGAGLSLTGNTFANTGVTSFNGRTGSVTLTSGDVTIALGYIPSGGGGVGGVTSFNGREGVVTLTSSDVATALGYTPGSGTGTVSSVTVAGTAGRITSSGSPITTSGTVTMDLSTSGVAASTYGSSTQVPVFSVDAYGRITSATTNPVISSGFSGNWQTQIYADGYTAYTNSTGKTLFAVGMGTNSASVRDITANINAANSSITYGTAAASILPIPAGHQYIVTGDTGWTFG